MHIADTIKVMIGGAQLELKPRLRFAMRLEKTHGLDKILIALRERNLTLIVDLMSDHCEPRLRQVFESIDDTIEPLFRYTLACFWIKETTDDESAKDRQKVTFKEWHEQLYRIATGWLGYTPPKH